VETAIASGQTIYGINTGFGKLANVRVAPTS
jgi:Histidine ammonia-lyase